MKDTNKNLLDTLDKILSGEINSAEAKRICASVKQTLEQQKDTKGKQKGKTHPHKKLSSKFVDKKKHEAGFYSDGEGLYLKVDKSGAKRWIQRLVISGKRRDMGLGSANLVGLSDARETARKNRALARSGGDPIAEKNKLDQKQEIPTFKEASYSVHALHLPTWKNKKHAQQWINTLEKYVFPIFGDKRVDEVSKPDLMDVLSLIWTEKPETASRVKQRIGSVLKWSIAKGWRIDNPADTIQEALPKQDKSKIKHHLSLPYDQVAQAIEQVQNTNALPITKLAFEFLVLTATRSGDTRGARWDEINGDLWTIPDNRIKMKKALRIPLSNRCLEILSIVEQYKDGSGLVFPNNGKPLSDSTLSNLLKDNLIQAVPHGFRTSFKTWAVEKTNAPYQASEFALAHVIRNKAEAAYQRSDLLDIRRNLMNSWAQYVGNERANVIPMLSNKKN